MSNYHFFAMMARMKYIKRWSLMHNWDEENISEHSLEVAMIAHALAVINNVRIGGNVNPDRAAVLGMFHDTTEIITGDMPTPIKYFNPIIKTAYKDVEDIAARKLLEMLPEDMRKYYREIYYMEDSESDKTDTCMRGNEVSSNDVSENNVEDCNGFDTSGEGSNIAKIGTGDKDTVRHMWKLVKAADKLSALIKCIKEEKMGNFEFTSALKSTRKSLEEMNLPEVTVFMEEFLDSFALTLDELQEYNTSVQ